MRFINKKYLSPAFSIAGLFIVLGLITMGVLFLHAHRSLAQYQYGDPGGAPFGGMVTSVFYCACSNNYRLTVSPPVGGTFMYEPGATIVYEFYMIPVVGVWLLGLYGEPIACIVPCGKGCCTTGSYPMILMTGTSM